MCPASGLADTGIYLRPAFPHIADRAKQTDRHEQRRQQKIS